MPVDDLKLRPALFDASGQPTVLTDGHAARARDLAADLGRGQHPAGARLRPLAQLDLDRPHRVRRRAGPANGSRT